MDGGLASRNESGYASFDMKLGLLHRPNARRIGPGTATRWCRSRARRQESKRQNACRAPVPRSMASPSRAVTALDGGLASRHEDGYASFDMKPGLLHGPNAKTDRAGHRYNV